MGARLETAFTGSIGRGRLGLELVRRRPLGGRGLLSLRRRFGQLGGLAPRQVGLGRLGRPGYLKRVRGNDVATARDGRGDSVGPHTAAPTGEFALEGARPEDPRPVRPAVWT